MYICYMHIGVLRHQKMTLDSLELELYVVVSHLIWVLGTKLGSSGGETSALNISSAPLNPLFTFCFKTGSHYIAQTSFELTP